MLKNAGCCMHWIEDVCQRRLCKGCDHTRKVETVNLRCESERLRSSSRDERRTRKCGFSKQKDI